MDSNGVYWESTDRSPDHRRRPRQPTPVLSPGNSHGRRSPVGRGPRGREESNTTERLPFPFSLPRIGEGRYRQPTPVLSPGNSHGRRSPVGRGPRGREESNTTERLPFPFSLPRIGEGRGN